jgi:hypothetical protein
MSDDSPKRVAELAHDLREFSVWAARWPKMSDSQRAEAKRRMRDIILTWPQELCEAMEQSLRERLKK